jgi:hypothetical protein
MLNDICLLQVTEHYLSTEEWSDCFDGDLQVSESSPNMEELWVNTGANLLIATWSVVYTFVDITVGATGNWVLVASGDEKSGIRIEGGINDVHLLLCANEGSCRMLVVCHKPEIK